MVNNSSFDAAFFAGCCLLCGTLKHLFFNSHLGNEAENVDLLGLADTMSAVHGLKISLRVPVTVKENDNVGRSQVDTQATGAGGQEKQKLL
ncbi:chromatin remodelling complex ATPase chain ISW1 [Pyrenophora tritici-repentis]|nr:chromatin remodelling complex ATPase chain ISW1 [Pyrenophora tritici-repentis]KAI1527390.1 HepA Superfamily II DNA RNA helicase SNF2 family [Pyrenophora tritici-repentis]KAI1566164.1 HepA Superfamily II DNA RNA helicase SNF2 family [Pyrenophora tritici-repentis]KAI1580206.1 HepA Superfamily II DNA RNA helicase SNF2 family [Pyrenophora tritici-repentis]